MPWGQTPLLWNRNDKALGSLLEGMEKAFHDWTFKFLKPPKVSETNLVIVDTLVYAFTYIGEVN